MNEYKPFSFFLGETESKHEERALSKADKQTKRKGNSFKKDPMTQTRLSNFFQKASSKTPRSSPDESAGEDLVTNERDLNPEDTTLKLEETENLDNQQRNIHEDTTLKIDEIEQYDNDDKEEGQQNIPKTFVINITLKGVPSDSKGIDDSKNNNNKHESNKRPHNDNISKVKESLSPIKVKPTAKRKIKALFGDSSGSDSEPNDDKKVKLGPEFTKQVKEQQHESKSTKIDRNSKRKIEKHKSKSAKPEHCESKQNNLASEQSKRIKSETSERKKLKREKEEHRDSKKYEREDETKSKSSESKHKKLKKKDEKKSHKRTLEKLKSKNVSEAKHVTSIFGNLSGSDSEKELIIDEGLESLNNNEEEAQDNQPTNFKETEDLEIETDPGTDTIKTSEHNMQQEINNSDELNSSKTELDDNKLDKAHRLSIEADKVLQELKQFSEMPPEPNVVEKKVEKEVKSTETSDVSRSTSKHKSQESKRHKLSLSGKAKDKHCVKERRDKRHTKIEDRKERHLKLAEHLNEKKLDKEDPSKKTEKVDVASLVVKLLMPYYKKKKISSRDLFKITARHIVHQLLAIQITGKISYITFDEVNSFNYENDDSLETTSFRRSSHRCLTQESIQ